MLNVLYTEIANTPRHQECIWKRKAKPNEKSCPLEELRIAKAGYRKNTKQPIKLTTFDPTSLELDNESLMGFTKSWVRGTCAICSCEA